MVWVEKSFTELSALEVYGLLRLRQRVFVLEQRCLYPDVDGRDLVARHLWLPRGTTAAARGSSPALVVGGEEPAAYLRILPPKIAYDEPSIGRVVTAPELRRQRLGYELLREGLARTWARFGAVPVRISAQAHLEPFYAAVGFRRVTDDYDEDGIPHLEMLISP